MPDTAALIPLFTRAELKEFRYKCSNKLVVSLTVGAIYLLGVTVFFLNKAVHNAAAQDKLQYYGLAAAGYAAEWMEDQRPGSWNEGEASSTEDAGYASALASVSAVTAAYGASQRDSGGSGGGGSGCDSGGSSGGGGGGGW